MQELLRRAPPGGPGGEWAVLPGAVVQLVQPGGGIAGNGATGHDGGDPASEEVQGGGEAHLREFSRQRQVWHVLAECVDADASGERVARQPPQAQCGPLTVAAGCQGLGVRVEADGGALEGEERQGAKV